MLMDRQMFVTEHRKKDVKHMPTMMGQKWSHSNQKIQWP